MLTRENAAQISSQALATFADTPPIGSYAGRGIVICGGGIKYGTCAWVLIRLLRQLGCQLPIEVWCLNDDELDPQWAQLVAPLNVVCVNASEVQKKHPHGRLGGWELKPYAMLHSRFREILLLDADNAPVTDPTFLFDSAQYRETGTVFWPDPPNLFTPPGSACWEIFGVPYRKCPDQESGQLLIDKERCWAALSLCNWYNEHSDFYYKYVYGDKETFRFAWQRLEQPISWIPLSPDCRVRFTLGQRDFEGNVLFQHRNARKWQLYGENQRAPGFQHESLCLDFVEELRRIWQPQRHLMRNVNAEDRAVMAALADKWFLYDRPGHNRWPVRLGAEGKIEEGYGPNEFFWWCEQGRIHFIGTDGKRKSVLGRANSGDWGSEFCALRKMHVHLRPTTA